MTQVRGVVHIKQTKLLDWAKVLLEQDNIIRNNLKLLKHLVHSKLFSDNIMLDDSSKTMSYALFE